MIHLRTQYLGPEELLVAAKIAVSSSLPTETVAEAIDHAEARLRDAVPEARLVYLEPDLDRSDACPGRRGARPDAGPRATDRAPRASCPRRQRCEHGVTDLAVSVAHPGISGRKVAADHRRTGRTSRSAHDVDPAARRALPDQVGGTVHRRHRRAGQQAPTRARRLRPHRLRRRGAHRRRHLHHHRARRRGHHRPGDRHLVRHRRDRLRVRGPLLRRVRLDGAGGGQCLHVLLRHVRRVHRLDHRLGPHPRVRPRRGRGVEELGASTWASCSAAAAPPRPSSWAR